MITSTEKQVCSFHIALAVLLVTGLFLVFGASSAKAQTEFQPGVKAGVTSMTVGGDNVSDEIDRRTGFVVGGFVKIDLGGPIGLRPEITYVQKGSSSESTIIIDSEGNETQVESTTKLDYIELPVLLDVYIPVEGNIAPRIFAGPTVGFNINAEAETEASGGSSTTDLSDAVSDTEFGVAFGAGIDIEADFGTVLIDARYQLGLTNILDESNFGEFDVGTSRNQGFAVGLGVAF